MIRSHASQSHSLLVLCLTVRLSTNCGDFCFFLPQQPMLAEIQLYRQLNLLCQCTILNDARVQSGTDVVCLSAAVAMQHGQLRPKKCAPRQSAALHAACCSEATLGKC